jgi:hypothetical protein
MKRVLKFIGILLIGVIALALITALFVKKEYSVEKQVTVMKPERVVFDYIKMLKNQDQFSVWSRMDPNMKKTFRGTDGTVGAVSAWDSEKDDVGKGEQEIVKINDGERIDYQLRFIEPFESTSGAYMTTDSIAPNQTLTKWGFNGKMNYPLNLMLLCMDMEGMIGKDLQTGLNHLKSNLEK